MSDSPPSIRPVMLRADLRPYRLAFLVNVELPDTVERAIRAASMVWGGWRCPLIAVADDGTVEDSDRERIGLLDCDGFYNLAADGRGGLRWPNVRLGPQLKYPEGDRRWWPSSPLLLSDSYAGRSNNQVEAAVPLERPLLEPEQVAGVPRLWALAALGGVWAAEDLDALSSQGVAVGPPSDFADFVIAQLSRRTLLAATSRHDVDAQVPTQPGGILSSALVLTVIPKSPQGDQVAPAEANTAPDLTQRCSDVIAWWNARATKPVKDDRLASRSVIVPVHAIEDDRVVDALRRVVYDVDCSPALFVTAGPEASAEDLVVVRDRLGFGDFSGTYSDEWSTSAHLSPGVGIGDPSSRWAVPRAAGTPATVPAVLTQDGTTVRYQPPAAVVPSLSGPVVVRASFRVMPGPRRPAVASLYLAGGRWDGDGVSAVLPDLVAPDLRLGDPTPQAILHACFTEEWKQPPYRLGDKGRQVTGLLERIRSAKVADTVLYRRATLAIAAALTPPPDRDLINAVQALADQRHLSEQELLDALGRQQRRPASLFAELWSDPEIKTRVKDRNDLADLLEQLARARLIEMTLPVVCSACGERGWLPVEAAPPLPSCPGCGLPARYVHTDRSPDIAYRASSLLARAYTNGSLVPAAATIRLSGPLSYVLPGADIDVPVPGAKIALTNPKGGTRDLDLLGWRYNQLLVGEAKSSPGAFTDEQLVSTVELAAHVGANLLLLVCPDPLSDDTLPRAVELAKEHDLQVEALTGAALFV